MASPSSGGLTKAMRILSSLPISRQQHRPMPPYFSRGKTGMTISTNLATPPPLEWSGETITTIRGLIPIPVGWAPLFLD
jgi:hypothetical protein